MILTIHSIRTIVKILLLIFLFILGSCAKSAKPRTVKLMVASNTSAITASISGGLILKLEKGTGESNIVELAAAPYDVVLANGDWTVYAIGFSGPGAWAGNAYCGQAKTTLDGNDATVTINATTANCANTPYPQLIATKKTDWDSATWDQSKWGP